ncbi:MAG: DedA family protein [Labilithrix sp.]|nr:DedA family protein [Labilithrix sp.]
MIDLVHATWRLCGGVSTLLHASMSSTLAPLIARWGYAAVAVGVFFEGETIVIVAGAMAHRGLLSLPGVIVAAFAGSVTGDQLWFHLGHRYGRGFAERRPAWRRRAERVEALFERYGTFFVLAFRFFYGFRTITPVVLGVVGYPAGRYTILNAIGAALWAVAFGSAGYGLGAGLRGILRRTTRVEELLLAAIVAGALLWLASRVIGAARRRTTVTDTRSCTTCAGTPSGEACSSECGSGGRHLSLTAARSSASPGSRSRDRARRRGERCRSAKGRCG